MVAAHDHVGADQLDALACICVVSARIQKELLHSAAASMQRARAAQISGKRREFSIKMRQMTRSRLSFLYLLVCFLNYTVLSFLLLVVLTTARQNAKRNRVATLAILCKKHWFLRNFFTNLLLPWHSLEFATHCKAFKNDFKNNKC